MSLRVANVITGLNSASGGPPRVVLGMARAAAGSWHADLFSTTYRSGANDRLLTDEFPGRVRLQPPAALSWRSGLLRMARVVRSHERELFEEPRPDIVHLHGLWSPFIAAYAIAAKRRRIPYILTVHGALDPWALSVRRYRKLLALRAYQGEVLAKAAAIHAASQLEARHVRALSCTTAPVFVVPNAVDVPAQVPSSDGRAPGGDKVLLFLSRLHEVKGLDMLLQAWDALRPAAWRLLIVGSGDAAYGARLQQYCEDRSVPNVRFHPHVEGEDREAMFRDASAFILPSRSENFGNVVAEAMMRELPVITTTGTPWSALSEHDLGWCVEPSVEALKQALERLFGTDARELQAMGRRGRDYAMRHFSPAAVRDALLQMYLAALAAVHPRPARADEIAGVPVIDPRPVDDRPAAPGGRRHA